MIQTGTAECEHCGKTLIRKSDESDEKASLIGLDSWQQKKVPAWLMYAVVALGLFCLVLMYSRGCKSDDQDQNACRYPNANHRTGLVASSTTNIRAKWSAL